MKLTQKSYTMKKIIFLLFCAIQALNAVSDPGTNSGSTTTGIAIKGGSNVAVEVTDLGSGEYELSAAGSDYNSYKWSNAAGETIGTGESITVPPKPNDSSYRVLAVTEDGEAAMETVSLASEIGIKCITDLNTGNMIIEFEKPVPSNATVTIRSIFDSSIQISKIVTEGTVNLSIDKIGLPSGLYSVTYTIADEVMDQKKVKF